MEPNRAYVERGILTKVGNAESYKSLESLGTIESKAVEVLICNLDSVSTIRILRSDTHRDVSA